MHQVDVPIRLLWRLMHNGPPTVMVDHRRVSRITICVKRSHDIVVSKGLPVGLNALVVNPRHVLRDVLTSIIDTMNITQLLDDGLGKNGLKRPRTGLMNIGVIVNQMAKQLDAWHAVGTPSSLETTAVMACDIVATAESYNCECGFYNF